MVSKQVVTISIATVATALFFQNCGKVAFNSLSSTPVLTTQSTPTTPTDITNGYGTTTPPPTPNITTTPNTSSTSNTGTYSSTPDNDKPETGDNDDAPDNDNPLVECDLLGPNTKVVLSGSTGPASFADGSNSDDTRVCMHKSACMELVNAYAQKHDCTLATGKATTPDNTAECAEVFPGSEGTCEHAQVLDDDVVESILTNMQTTD